MKKAIFWTIIIFTFFGLIYLFREFQVVGYLSLSFLKTNIVDLKSWGQDHLILSSLVFFLIYMISAAISLPCLSVLSMAAGAIFGLWHGIVLVSFASTIGATVAFLVSRMFLKKWLMEKHGEKIAKINTKIAGDCPFYLLSMRLLPVAPFLFVNVAMGLSDLKTKTFFTVSQIGMFAGTTMYVNAGMRISEINTVSEVFSKRTIIAFFVLSAVPVALRRIVRILNLKQKNLN